MEKIEEKLNNALDLINEEEFVGAQKELKEILIFSSLLFSTSNKGKPKFFFSARNTSLIIGGGNYIMFL